MTWIAQDNFVGESAEGAWLTVTKGQAFPDNHPMVRLDRDAADAAASAGVTRTALFAPMDLGEPEPAPKPAVKAPASRKGA